MSFRATLFWVLSFAVLVTAYWVTDRREQTQQRAIEEAKRIFEYAPGDVTTLSLKWFDEDRAIEAVRTGSRWSFVAPYEYVPADQAAWDQLAAAAVALTNERTIDVAPDDLSAYGLDNPRLTLLVGAGSGTLQQVAIGGPDPTKTYLYIRVDDGDVMLGGAEPILALNRRLDDLRDRRIFSFGDAVLSKISYTGQTRAAPVESFALSLERVTGETWQITAPADAIPNQRKVMALAAELAQAKGRGYIDEPANLSDYGLAPPFATIEASAGGDPKTLLVGWVASGDGSEAGGLYAKLHGLPSVFEIDARILALLPGDADAFRERRLFTRRAEALERIRYASDQASFTLENDPYAGWKFEDPPYTDIDQVAVSNYVGVLRRVEGRRFPGEEIAARVRIEFDFSDGSAPAAIEIGDVVPESNPPEFYARLDSGAVTTLSFESAMALRAQAIEFRNRDLLNFIPRDARAVDLTFDGRRYRFERDAQAWALAEPADHMLESAADLEALLRMLSNLRASEIDDLPPSPRSQGMHDPLCSVQVTVSPSDDPSASTVIGPLHVAKPVSQELSRLRFATVAGRDAVYHVEQSFIDDLRDILGGVIPRP